MSPRHLFGETTPTPEASDYVEQLQAMAVEEGLSEGVLSERGIQLSADWLQRMRQDFGEPDSDHYNPYHNEKHSLNIIRRSWQIWKILQETLPERFDDSGFEDLMLAGAVHDLINDPEAARDHPGKNEAASGDLAYQEMQAAGYSKKRAATVRDMAIATTVGRNEQGVIVQTQIRQGSKDPRKLVIAQADMNGIVMEGIPRMVSDAVDLYLEFSQTPVRDALKNPLGAINFFGTQAKYLGDRIDALSEDLDYYFEPVEKELVLKAYQEYFSGASRDAISAAKMLAEFPEVTKAIVESSFNQASTVTQRSIGQVATAKQHMVNQLRRVRQH